MKQALLALPLVLLLSEASLANGAMASFPAGGVVFMDSADIALAEENLYLSPEEVRVNYIFSSSATAVRSVTLGFPLPRVPAAPDTPDSVQNGEAGVDMRNYLGFGVAVNGRAVMPILHEFAWLDDRNVTAEVEAAGLPLLPDFDQMQEWSELDRTQAEPLIAAGLLQGEVGGYLSPRWDYQVIYEWPQQFEPGSTIVDIHYRPLMGWPGDFGDHYEIGAHAASACVDDALRQKIAALKAQNIYYEVAQLDYITTTAQHWAGPIGTFTVTVSTGDPSEEPYAATERTLIAMCPADASTTAAGDRMWSATDYVADKDLRVFFYFFSDQN